VRGRAPRAVDRAQWRKFADEREQFLKRSIDAYEVATDTWHLLATRFYDLILTSGDREAFGGSCCRTVREIGRSRNE